MRDTRHNSDENRTLNSWTSLLNQFRDAVIGKTMEGIITSWNKGAESMYGYSAQEINGKSITTIIPKEKLDEFHEIMNKLRRGEKVEDLETIRITKEGKRIHVLLTIYPMATESNEILGATTIASDITEQKKAEEQFRTAVEAAPNGMLMAGPDGKIIFVNSQIEKLFGYAREELVGQPVEILVPFRYRKPHINYRGSFLKHPETRPMGAGRDLYGLHKDGHEVPVEIGLNPIKKTDGVYVLTSIIDITERKRYEQKRNELVRQLEKMNEELTHFAHVISHDLKTPLHGIGTIVEWLNKDYAEKIDEKGRKYLTLLTQQIKITNKLIDGILQYSRIGRTAEKMEDIDMTPFISELVAIMTPPEHIQIEVAPDLPVVHADKTRIQQIFQNLISNAIKFMDKEKGTIKIGTQEKSGEIIFFVEDNGPGIDEKFHKKIFNMFESLQPKNSVESTGIGLAIVKRIIELYGGRIWVKSQKEDGSIFFFTFPKSMLSNVPKSSTDQISV